MEQIREPIRTAVLFTPGEQIKPVWFDWRRRQHRIVRTTYRWQEKQGETLLLHFAVTDGETLYELIYNVQQQQWLLNSREAG